MAEDQDPKVLEFRMQRLRKAPRNWTYWIAGFTAANGIFLAIQHDITIIAGLALPFAISGPAPHLIAGAILAVIAYTSSKLPELLFIPLVTYIIDTCFAAYAQLWSGVFMHLVVLAFVGFSFVGIRALQTAQAKQNEVSV